MPSSTSLTPSLCPASTWHGAVSVHQAYRPRKFLLAAIGRAWRLGDAFARAARHAARRNRLAHAGAFLATASRRLNRKNLHQIRRSASSIQRARVESNMQLDLNSLPTETALLHCLVRDIAATIEHRDGKIERLKSIIKQIGMGTSPYKSCRASIASNRIIAAWTRGRRGARVSLGQSIHRARHQSLQRRQIAIAQCQL
jgi:hypothetical protein